MGCQASISAAASNALHIIIDDVTKSSPCCCRVVGSRRGVEAHQPAASDHVIRKSREQSGATSGAGDDEHEKILRDTALDNTTAASFHNGSFVREHRNRKHEQCMIGSDPTSIKNGSGVTDPALKTIRVRRQSVCSSPLTSNVIARKYDVDMTPTPEVSLASTLLQSPGRPQLVANGDVQDTTENRKRKEPLYFKVANERLGRKVQYLDARWHTKDCQQSRPVVVPGELWTDHEFNCNTAMKTKADEVFWKRPHEFCSDPRLIRNGTDRFDINQGQAGTCWLLSVLASLAERQDVIEQIIPETESYKIGTEQYDGIFHCQLWKLGRWYDVYVDDYLPVCRDTGQLWGAHSTDPNELWVSLIEKAFARFFGSYEAVYGGWAGSAFTTLTGGVAEKVKTSTNDPDYPVVDPEELFTRVHNALTCGSIVSATVYAAPPDESVESVDDTSLCGLIGGHAYTVTSASTIEFDSGNIVQLLRVRNPWGQGHGEWTGPWSDDSEEWKSVSLEVRRQLEVQFEPDGEFWMCLDDYCRHFSTTNICSLSPDFDRDGLDDGLCHVMTILGEWTEPSFGSALTSRLRNPRYVLTIPDAGPRDSDGYVWVVLQLLQEQTADQSLLVYCRLDFYQIDADYPVGVSDQPATDQQIDVCNLCLHELINYTVFTASPGLCYRYRLFPGRYLLLPNYISDKSLTPSTSATTTMTTSLTAPEPVKPFCIRIFTGADVTCRQLLDFPHAFVRRTPTSVDVDGATYHLTNIRCEFGEWLKGFNAGGQISFPTLHTNPQYCIELSGDASACNQIQPVFIDLIQEAVEPIHSVGYFVYKVSSGVQLPLDYSYMIKNFDQMVPGTQTGSYTFVQSCLEAHGVYLLECNKPYVIVAFADKPTDFKRYAVVLATQAHYRLKIRSFNVSLPGK